MWRCRRFRPSRPSFSMEVEMKNGDHKRTKICNDCRYVSHGCTASHTVPACAREGCAGGRPMDVSTGTALRNRQGGIQDTTYVHTYDVQQARTPLGFRHPSTPGVANSLPAGRTWRFLLEAPRLHTSGCRRRKPGTNQDGGPVELGTVDRLRGSG